jgi:hypothetical protein
MKVHAAIVYRPDRSGQGSLNKPKWKRLPKHPDQHWHIEALQGHLHQAFTPQSAIPQKPSQGLT